MVQSKKIIKSIIALIVCLLMGWVVYIYYFKFHLTQVYYSPSSKYRIEMGWRFSSPADSMDNLYRLIDTQNSEVIWEWNMEDSLIKDIDWKDEVVFLFFQSGNNNRLKYNIKTGEMKYLDSDEWKEL